METYYLSAGIAADEWLTEIGGGPDCQRKLFRNLRERIGPREVAHLPIAHRDRLSRFGCDWFGHCAKRHGYTLTVVNREGLSPQADQGCGRWLGPNPPRSRASCTARAGTRPSPSAGNTSRNGPTRGRDAGACSRCHGPPPTSAMQGGRRVRPARTADCAGARHAAGCPRRQPRLPGNGQDPRWHQSGVPPTHGSVVGPRRGSCHPQDRGCLGHPHRLPLPPRQREP